MKIDFKNTYKNAVLKGGQMFICPICGAHFPVERNASEGIICCICQDMLNGYFLKTLCRMYRYEYINFVNLKVEPDLSLFCNELYHYNYRMKVINTFLNNECVLSETYITN